MSSRKNPSSRGSRSSSPRLAFEVRPCRQAQLVWALFGLVAGVALWLSIVRAHTGLIADAIPNAATAVLVAVTGAAVALVVLALGALAGLAVLGVKGPLAIRRFEWTPEGEWHLWRPDGRFEIGRLGSATATLGPWILLAWTVGSGFWHPLRRRYALIGVTQVGPEAFRALKGRLSLLGGRHSGSAGQFPDRWRPDN